MKASGRGPEELVSIQLSAKSWWILRSGTVEHLMLLKTLGVFPELLSMCCPKSRWPVEEWIKNSWEKRGRMVPASHTVLAFLLQGVLDYHGCFMAPCCACKHLLGIWYSFFLAAFSFASVECQKCDMYLQGISGCWSDHYCSLRKWGTDELASVRVNLV